MASRQYLEAWLQSALVSIGGKGTVRECEEIWQRHESELRNSGDPFYSWQYDVRWAANRLRRKNKMKPVGISPTGIWELK
jgi:hypothetical protein